MTGLHLHIILEDKWNHMKSWTLTNELLQDAHTQITTLKNSEGFLWHQELQKNQSQGLRHLQMIYILFQGFGISYFKFWLNWAYLYTCSPQIADLHVAAV